MSEDAPNLKAKKGKGKSHSLYLPDSTWKALCDLAAETGQKPSGVAAELLDWAEKRYRKLQAIKQSGDGNGHDSGADSESTPSHT